MGCTKPTAHHAGPRSPDPLDRISAIEPWISLQFWPVSTMEKLFPLRKLFCYCPLSLSKALFRTGTWESLEGPSTPNLSSTVFPPGEECSQSTASLPRPVKTEKENSSHLESTQPLQAPLYPTQNKQQTKTAETAQ